MLVFTLEKKNCTIKFFNEKAISSIPDWQLGMNKKNEKKKGQLRANPETYE